MKKQILITMKRTAYLFKTAVLAAAFLMASCTSYKRVPYMQNSRDVNLDASAVLYEARIMPKDEMTITVGLPGSQEDQDAVRPFNLTVKSTANNSGRVTLSTQEVLQTYLVRNDGTIDFPVLGTLNVGGMTVHEVEEMIASRLQGTYLKKHPVVTVHLSNYKISVLGEVTSPGTYTVPSEKVSVYDALALAKDMTVYGRRDNVKIVREGPDGKKSIHELDLNDANIINSPFYYLQQNDVLYVTPNKTKSRNSDIGSSTTTTISIIGTLMSLTSLIVTLTK